MEKVVPRLMFISVTSHLVLRTYKFVLTLSVPGGGGGGEKVYALISTFENFLAI